MGVIIANMSNRCKLDKYMHVGRIFIVVGYLKGLSHEIDFKNFDKN